jgi:hypothetical protein
MADPDLREALSLREVVKAYGAALHVATTLRPPPSPVRLHQGIGKSRPPRPPSPLARIAIRFIAWFG